MARSPNCTGAPLYKGRVDVTITYPDPYEPPLLDPPEALPTAEPATAQIEITITQAMLPVWSPFELEHDKVGILYAAGTNTTASAVSISCRLLLNGSSAVTGTISSCPANYKWTWAMGVTGVKVDDVLSCKLWSSMAGVDCDQKACAVHITRIKPNCQIPGAAQITIADQPVLKSGPSPYTYNGPYYYYLAPMHAYQFTSPGTTSLNTTANHDVYGLGRVYLGDNHTPGWETHQTRKPLYYKNRVITRLSYTPLNLRVR